MLLLFGLVTFGLCALIVDNELEDEQAEDCEEVDTNSDSPENPRDLLDQDDIDSNSACGRELSGVNIHLDVATGIVNLHSDSADHLTGGNGDDTLLIGAHDIAEGGLGEDTFVVDGNSEGKLPKILDFEPSKDTVRISLPSTEKQLEETWPDRPDFTGEIEVSMEKGNTTIWVDGTKVCILEGLHELSESNVSVEHDYRAGMPSDFDKIYGYS